MNKAFTFSNDNDKIKKNDERGEIEMRRKRRAKRGFSSHTIVIILGLALIAVAVHLLFNTDLFETEDDTQQIASAKPTENTTKEVKVIGNANTAKEISEKEARKLAVKQCKELNEKNVKEKELEVIEFTRANEYYYYISSKQNTVEIKKAGGIITRINSVPVQ